MEEEIDQLLTVSAPVLGVNRPVARKMVVTKSMSAQERFFMTGTADSGDLHASAGLWGPALCDETLRMVDDNRKYGVDVALALDLCPSCHAALVAEVTTEARHYPKQAV